VLLNTIDGVRAVDSTLEDVSRCYRLTRRQRLFSVLLPSAAPQIFAGMRVALAVAFIPMIVSEMVAATNGIGHATLSDQGRFKLSSMWAGMVLLATLGYLFNVVFVAVERKVLRWHHSVTQGAGW
jgi:ABC-type nitrate/sulfonate/bicarbonate transport system permease component